MTSLLYAIVDDLAAPTPAKTLDAARLHFADALVAAFAGTTTSEGRRAAGPASLALGGDRPPGDGGDDGETLLGGVAALARLIRCTETDDIDLSSCTTPAAFAVPAALGAAARDGGATAERLLTAIAAGYEVGIRLGEVIGGPFALYQGTWPTLAVAPAAAAAAAGVAAGLGRAELAGAIFRAAHTPYTGSFATEHDRWAGFGGAVATGVRAATEVDNESLEGYEGAGSPSLPALLAAPFEPSGLEMPWERLRRARMKRFASAAQVAAAIDAVCRMVDRSEIAPASITEIVIGVPHFYAAMINRSEVTDRIGSLLSAQYQVAVAITHREDLFDVARVSLRADAVFTRLASVTRVVVNEDLDDHYPAEWPATVSVVAGGERFEALSRAESPDPSWTAEKVLDKAERFFFQSGIDESAQQICDLVAVFSHTDEISEGLRSTRLGVGAR